MRLLDDRLNTVVLSSGRRLDNGLLWSGLLNSLLVLRGGQENPSLVVDELPIEGLTAEERREIADVMLLAWDKWGGGERPAEVVSKMRADAPPHVMARAMAVATTFYRDATGQQLQLEDLTPAGGPLTFKATVGGDGSVDHTEP